MLINHPIILIATYLWVGFVCAISFMEAWLKFRAPGVTILIGLGIGKLVFSALNKVEWLFALVIFINQFSAKTNSFNSQNALYYIALVLLIIQTIWLLPALDAKAKIHM